MPQATHRERETVGREKHQSSNRLRKRSSLLFCWFDKAGSIRQPRKLLAQLNVCTNEDDSKFISSLTVETETPPYCWQREKQRKKANTALKHYKHWYFVGCCFAATVIYAYRAAAIGGNAGMPPGGAPPTAEPGPSKTCFCCDFCISSIWARSTSNTTGASRIIELVKKIHDTLQVSE